MDQLYAERLIIITDLQHRQISPTIAPVFKIHLTLTNIFDLSSFLDFSWQESTNQNHSFGNTFFTAVVCSMTFTFTPCHDIVPVDMYHQTYFFSSNHNIYKSLYGFFQASNPFNDRFYQNLSIKGSEVQKQRPHELL